MIHCNNCNASYTEKEKQNIHVCRYCKKEGYTFYTTPLKLYEFLFKNENLNMDAYDAFTLDGLDDKELNEFLMLLKSQRIDFNKKYIIEKVENIIQKRKINVE